MSAKREWTIFKMVDLGIFSTCSIIVSGTRVFWQCWSLMLFRCVCSHTVVSVISSFPSVFLFSLILCSHLEYELSNLVPHRFKPAKTGKMGGEKPDTKNRVQVTREKRKSEFPLGSIFFPIMIWIDNVKKTAIRHYLFFFIWQKKKKHKNKQIIDAYLKINNKSTNESIHFQFSLFWPVSLYRYFCACIWITTSQFFYNKFHSGIYYFCFAFSIKILTYRLVISKLYMISIYPCTECINNMFWIFSWNLVIIWAFIIE